MPISTHSKENSSQLRLRTRQTRYYAPSKRRSLQAQSSRVLSPFLPSMRSCLSSILLYYGRGCSRLQNFLNQLQTQLPSAIPFYTCPFVPLTWPFTPFTPSPSPFVISSASTSALRLRTPCARVSRTASVSSQPMQASVIDLPY